MERDYHGPFFLCDDFHLVVDWRANATSLATLSLLARHGSH
jgi:hypothetical protein